MMMKSGVKNNDSIMQDAIEQALKCDIDVPIGCVIKKNGKIVASAHNRREADNDVTAHAEILAIKDAQKALNSSRLTDCEMFVTLEPCPMCSWAILKSGIKTLYFGAYNPDYGVFISNPNCIPPKYLPLSIKVYGGIDEEKCARILEEFFKKLR